MYSMGHYGCKVALKCFAIRSNPSPQYTPTIITAYFYEYWYCQDAGP